MHAHIKGIVGSDRPWCILLSCNAGPSPGARRQTDPYRIEITTNGSGGGGGKHSWSSFYSCGDPFRLERVHSNDQPYLLCPSPPTPLTRPLVASTWLALSHSPRETSKTHTHPVAYFSQPEQPTLRGLSPSQTASNVAAAAAVTKHRMTYLRPVRSIS